MPSYNIMRSPLEFRGFLRIVSLRRLIDPILSIIVRSTFTHSSNLEEREKKENQNPIERTL